MEIVFFQIPPFLYLNCLNVINLEKLKYLKACWEKVFQEKFCSRGVSVIPTFEKSLVKKNFISRHDEYWLKNKSCSINIMKKKKLTEVKFLTIKTKCFYFSFCGFPIKTKGKYKSDVDILVKLLYQLFFSLLRTYQIFFLKTSMAELVAESVAD